MARTSTLLLTGLLLCLFSTSTLTAATQVELILDASGSMYNKLDDGRYRITAAKDVLSEFVRNLPQGDLDVGLRVYGSKIQPSAAGACQDSKLMVPVDGVQQDALLAAIKDTRARGKTPIAYSLEQAVADFNGKDRCLIVLVTDGEEVCDGDLQAAAAKLEQAGCDFDLRIIGFDLSAEAQATFKGIGTFENAKDAAALAGALERAVEGVVEKTPLGDATLSAPETVLAGSKFMVEWTGENGPRDYVTIVEPSATEGQFGSWTYTEKGSPLELVAPATPGNYELRYQSERVDGVAARRSITVTPAEFAIGGPAVVKAGQPFEIPWVGPNNEKDYLTVVPADAPDGQYASYAYTENGSPARLHAPMQAGDYEIRYQSDREKYIVFARRPLTIEAVDVSLDVPAEINAGQSFEVEWTGPNGDRDYVTLVEADADDGKYGEYVYTENGSPVTLTAPFVGGKYQVRYQSDREKGVFARLDIEITSTEVTLQAPETVAAGAKFEITWTGPDGPRDYITIVKQGAEPGAYLDYRYTTTGPTVTLTAPEEPGNYEVRYQSDREKRVIFGSRPIRVQ